MSHLPLLAVPATGVLSVRALWPEQDLQDDLLLPGRARALLPRRRALLPHLLQDPRPANQRALRILWPAQEHEEHYCRSGGGLLGPGWVEKNRSAPHPIHPPISSHWDTTPSTWCSSSGSSAGGGGVGGILQLSNIQTTFLPNLIRYWLCLRTTTLPSNYVVEVGMPNRPEGYTPLEGKILLANAISTDLFRWLPFSRPPKR